MRIKKLMVHNYRSIKDLEIEFLPHMILIGPNNHGKSNLISALEFGLTTSFKPVEQDFFIHRDDKDNIIWVEMMFHDLTDQEKNTFRKYILSDETICIRKTAKISNGSVEVYYNGYIEQPEDDWLRFENSGNYLSREKINKTPLKDLVPKDGRLSKNHIEEAQQKYIRDFKNSLRFNKILENNPLLGQKNVGGGVLPEFYLIPAVRDLTDELKIKTTTSFGRLLNRAVREMAERDPHFAEARKQLEEVLASLNVRDEEDNHNNQLASLEKAIEEELLSWGVKVNIEVVPPELEKLFELGTNIHLDDGVRTPADRKGHGLQRALIFALLRSWAKALRSDLQGETEDKTVPRKQSDSVIFAMEEPELFLHPHAQRKLAASLREISKTEGHQVILCTHSTHFIDLNYYKEIAIITKDCQKSGSCVRQCTQELFDGTDSKERKKRFHMAHWVNPDRGEMFFAKRVVFVEGETEKVILPHLAEKFKIFNPDISIVDCGSKHNLPLYIAIAKAFNIPYIVIHDEDPLPEEIPDSWDENKKRGKEKTFNLNEDIANLVEKPLGQVEMFCPDFESCSGVSRSQAEKKGKALAALDHFDSIDVNDISEKLQEIVRIIYS